MANVRRPCLDADSHVLEPADWLAEFADPAIRPRLRERTLPGSGNLSDRAEAWQAPGASDPAERSRALDQLGFAAQLVTGTYSLTQFVPGDPDLTYGGASAHNRGITAFCADDPRLHAVGVVPWGDPARTMAAAVEAIDLGCAALRVGVELPAGTRSPTHRDYDGFWQILQDVGVPFVIHSTGQPTVAREFHDDGYDAPDYLGGGESIRAKDVLALSHRAEIFLGALVLDGVLERFPGVRGAALQFGALWVPSWLDRLDFAQRTFMGTEARVALGMRAREYVHRQLFVSPLVGEPVAELMATTGDDLYLFGSCYPLPQGSPDSRAHFEGVLENLPAPSAERFFHGNFATLLGRSLRVVP